MTAPPTTPLPGGARRVATVYGALVTAELQVAATYRAKLLLGAFSWLVPVAFMALWRGAAGGAGIDGISGDQFTTYFSVLLFTTTMQLSRNLAFLLEPMIHSGELSALLLRPHHPLHVIIARGVAEFTYRLTPLLVVIPLLIISIGGTVTRDPAQWVLGPAVAVLGTMAVAYLGAMMGTLGLWLTRSSGLRSLLFGAEWVFGGLIAPIALLPGVLPELLRHQPLWFAIGAAGEALSGISRINPLTVLEAAVWVLGLHLAFTRIWRRGMLRYEAVGT